MSRINDYAEGQHCRSNRYSLVGFRFAGKKPDTEDLRHQELLNRLDFLVKEITALRRSLARLVPSSLEQEARQRQGDAQDTHQHAAKPEQLALC